MRVLQQYVNEQSVTPLALNYDFGLITLASPAPKGTTTMNIVAGQGTNVVYNLTTAGYPADKPSQTMWTVRALTRWVSQAPQPPRVHAVISSRVVDGRL